MQRQRHVAELATLDGISKAVAARNSEYASSDGQDDAVSRISGELAPSALQLLVMQVTAMQAVAKQEVAMQSTPTAMKERLR